MTAEERQQKIDAILSTIKEKANYPDIPVRMWIVAETGNPGEPDFENWMQICTQYVDSYYQETGKRDTDSPFAGFVKKHGRREHERQG